MDTWVTLSFITFMTNQERYSSCIVTIIRVAKNHIRHVHNSAVTVVVAAAAVETVAVAADVAAVAVADEVVAHVVSTSTLHALLTTTQPSKYKLPTSLKTRLMTLALLRH